MRRSTEGGEAPGWQGATTENIGNMRERSNAARRDASPAECRRIYEMSSTLGHITYDRDDGPLPQCDPDVVTDMASDRYGKPVNIGTKVRIIELAQFLKRDVPPDEWARLAGMVGGIFEVSEIDEKGRAWIEQWFDDPDGGRLSHSVALEAHEMEVV